MDRALGILSLSLAQRAEAVQQLCAQIGVFGRDSLGEPRAQRFSKWLWEQVRRQRAFIKVRQGVDDVRAVLTNKRARLASARVVPKKVGRAPRCTSLSDLCPQAPFAQTERLQGVQTLHEIEQLGRWRVWWEYTPSVSAAPSGGQAGRHIQCMSLLVGLRRSADGKRQQQVGPVPSVQPWVAHHRFTHALDEIQPCVHRPAARADSWLGRPHRSVRKRRLNMAATPS
eukprot:scaffold18372_cov118-Isochrysis_galbana.AAC.1